MIARIWQGITLTSEADDYIGFLNERVLPGYREANGNQGIFVFRNTQGEITHFLLLSLWSSQEQLAGFNHPDESKSKYSAEEKHFLLAFESVAKHYEVISGVE